MVLFPKLATYGAEVEQQVCNLRPSGKWQTQAAVVIFTCFSESCFAIEGQFSRVYRTTHRAFLHLPFGDLHADGNFKGLYLISYFCFFSSILKGIQAFHPMS